MDGEYFMKQLANFSKKPTIPALVFLCSQLESCFQFSGAAQTALIKSCALNTVRAVKQQDAEFSSNENMLRLYNLVAQVSQNLGATGIYDRLEKSGEFEKSLKYHLYWAEAHAKAGNAQMFREIVELAKARITTMPPSQVEAGFRDIADEHLSSVPDLFHDEAEDTLFYLNVPKISEKKSRRRSSLAVLRNDALASIKPIVPVSSPTSKFHFANISDLVDRPDSDGYVSMSVEEWRVAKLKDNLFEEVDMDISVVDRTRAVANDDMDVSVVETAPTISMENVDNPSASSSSSSDMLNKTPIPQAGRPCKQSARMVLALSCVAEVSEDSNDSKRRRLDSPQCESEPRTPICNNGGGSFAENVHYNAAAVFSETIDLRSADTANDATMPVYVEPPQPFEVFVDHTLPTEVPAKETNPVVAAVKERPKLRELSSPQIDNVFQEEMEKPKFGSREAPITIMDIENIEAIPKDFSMCFDSEETLAGTRIATMGSFKPKTTFATSTPAVDNWKPSQEDFFKVPSVKNDSDKEEEDEEEEEETAAPSAFMRMRKSIGGSKSLHFDPKNKPGASQGQHNEVKETSGNSTMEKAMVKLTLDTSSGSSSNEVLERTRIGRPLETISGNNPWDKDFREAIMEQKGIQKPIVLHEFKGMSPKILKNRDVDLGGEIYQIHDLLGQGAFARVYHCTNELGEKLALKYEVPSCKFEVYICEQLKQRLISANSITASLCQKSIMEVSDGFVYQNASVLINSYIPFGTILDLANKMHDPSGLMMLYIAMQMAAILKEVHEVKVIHADVKPDNFMVQSRINENWTMDELFSTPLLKLIDWGRAIDMKYLPPGTTFTGKAGTKDFDCPEMMLGHPWSYHTDYYGFVGTLCVMISGKYCSFTDAGGKRSMNIALKRRLIGFDVFSQTFNELVNIPNDGPLPNWTNLLMKLRKAFKDNFDVVEWRKAVAKFNSSLPT